MKKQYTAFLIGILAVVGVTFFAVNAYAQSTLTPTEVKLINPIGGTAENPKGTTDIPVILGGIIQTALALMGSAALFMFVVGGVLWLTSAGNAERVKQGTQTMVWAAIGVLIIFSSYAILSLVLQGLGANTSPGASPQGNKTGGNTNCASIQITESACQKYSGYISLAGETCNSIKTKASEICGAHSSESSCANASVPEKFYKSYLSPAALFSGLSQEEIEKTIKDFKLCVWDEKKPLNEKKPAEPFVGPPEE